MRVPDRQPLCYLPSWIASNLHRGFSANRDPFRTDPQDVVTRYKESRFFPITWPPVQSRPRLVAVSRASRDGNW
jgi:hypothetical protein